MPHRIVNTDHAVQLTKQNIVSMPRLEKMLGIDRIQLRSVADVSDLFYHPFCPLPDQRPFARSPSKRKVRIIDKPTGALKNIQRRIYKSILVRIDVPSYLMGGIRGRSVLDNVSIHKDAKVLVRIDIKSFFPSITRKHVYDVWRHLLGSGDRIAELLTDLTTYDNRLPQGAPTSTHLANLVMFMIDGRIREACARSGVRYSTFIDDIALSGEEAPKLVSIVVETLHRAGFAVSHKKLNVMRGRTRKELTGLIVGRSPAIPVEYISRVRAAIHNISEINRERDCLDSYVRKIKGKITYVRGVNPNRANALDKLLTTTLERIG